MATPADPVKAWIVTRYRRSGIHRAQRIKVGPNCSRISWNHNAYWTPYGVSHLGYIAFPGPHPAFLAREEAEAMARKANEGSVQGHRAMREWHDKAANRIELHLKNPTGGRK
jgi:hypothetical protein